VNTAFWQNRRVFVTGHTGFKGAWLTLWLHALGARVSGYSLPPPTEPSLFDLAHVDDGIVSRSGDVRDAAALDAALAEARPEIVLHLAAQPIVRASYRDPVATYATNVMGTVHLLESVRRVPGIRAVVVVSSDKCYQNEEWPWPYNEEHRLGGHDPYSSSKACTELVVDAYRRSFFPPEKHHEHGLTLVSARAGNVIGGGDWAHDRLVPDIIKALVAGKKIRLRNPRATRPWQHVLEPLCGYLMLAEAAHREGPVVSGAWNFGPFDYANRSVSWMTEHLCAMWGGDAGWEQDGAPAPHEAFLLQVDSAKARSHLGWSPKLDPLSALQWTVDWTKAWIAGAPLRRFSEAQIATFQTMPAFDPLRDGATRPLPAAIRPNPLSVSNHAHAKPSFLRRRHGSGSGVPFLHDADVRDSV
jgi:CDP-glucose 4,6-dehydratase